MATMTENVQSMIDTLSDALGNAEKHDKGNKAAGTRLRKALQTVAKTPAQTFSARPGNPGIS